MPANHHRRQTAIPCSRPHLRPGFTLVEMVLVLVIIGVISAFMISISGSVNNFSKLALTKARMRTIAEQAKKYYLSHKQQAQPYLSNRVPVIALNLDKKYLYDGWGNFFYFRVDSEINGFKVNNGETGFGAVIFSRGGNGDFEINGYNDTHIKTFIINGDDLLAGVNLNPEAITIALDELKILQNKVEAFDALYEGINNDNGNDSDLDEDGCVADTGDNCPPNHNANDPNCGRATLEEIEENGNSRYYGNCTYATSAVDFIIAKYGLANEYKIDPWNQTYRWDAGRGRFYSCGPDGRYGNPNDDKDNIY